VFCRIILRIVSEFNTLGRGDHQVGYGQIESGYVHTPFTGQIDRTQDIAADQTGDINRQFEFTKQAGKRCTHTAFLLRSILLPGAGAEIQCRQFSADPDGHHQF